MIAYSSVSHIRTAASAIVRLSKISIKRAFLLIVAHGLCSSGLFFSINLIYKNINSRNTQIIKGYTNSHPSIILQWFLVCAINIAAPPSINFNSEITILRRIITYSNINSLPLILASIIVGIYCIIMFTFSSHGKRLSQNKKETRAIELLNQAFCNKILVTIFFVFNYL